MQTPMEKSTKCWLRTLATTALSLLLVLTGGCLSPDGSTNNSTTDAIVGGAFGALVGAATGGRHAIVGSLIGASAGALAGGLIGHQIDAQQQAVLQEEYPQTWSTIQYNDQVTQQQQQYQPQPAYAPPPPPDTEPPATTTTAPPAGSGAAPTPLTVNDIKALTAAGVKPDVIKQEIQESGASYSAADVTAVQSANPPVDPSVIAYMQNPAG